MQKGPFYETSCIISGKTISFLSFGGKRQSLAAGYCTKRGFEDNIFNCYYECSGGCAVRDPKQTIFRLIK